ncbi:eRF1 methyltransferase catalytic subunit MTQ2 [Madurella mycetomatis]|uniref:ERF1 methyltransferase catalytic subunit MTQ2 n=1 Tax=Madurella mycetomatis TaxID=100816 RepID=A0A175VS11_9PEZI|nr:eRF1 methyltransferase catalytic subunit MTQ2 [Madurella mycetomatis]
MLPTPCTSHVPYERVYEPAEDSFLLLDTLSSAGETAFLAARFPGGGPPPLVVEIGPGSGIVLAFLTAHARALFARRDVLTFGIDVNKFACGATASTVAKAVAAAGHVDEAMTTTTTTAAAAATAAAGGMESKGGHGFFLGAVQGDLAGAVRGGVVDVLVFNPPYVPTPEVPSLLPSSSPSPLPPGGQTAFEEDSRLLALSYAGGKDGMETTDRLIDALPAVLSERGCAYLLLCAQNKPEEVKERIRRMEGGSWKAETVGTSGKQAGWEKLQIVRIWKD